MNNNNPNRQRDLLLLSGVIVLGIIVFSVVVNIVYSWWKPDPTPDPIPTPTPSPEPTEIPQVPPIPTPSIKWEPYISNTYNFQFKHPQDWRREAIQKDALNHTILKFYLPNEEEPIMIMEVEEFDNSHYPPEYQKYSLPEYWDNILNRRLDKWFKNYTLEGRKTDYINDV